MNMKRLAILSFKTSSVSVQFLTPIVQEYLINNLNEIEAYTVISMESTSPEKLNTTTIKEVKDLLNTPHLITGELVDKEHIITVKVSYHNFDTGSKEDTEFQTPKKDLFKLGEYTLTEVKKLLQITSSNNSVSTSNKGIQNPETYQTYILGNYHFNRWTSGNVALAIEYYQKVIKEEAHFAPAYLKLAKCYIYQAGRGYELPNKVYPKARVQIRKAIAISPNSGEGAIYKNLIDFFYDLNWSNIYNSIEKGLKNYVDASEAYQQLSFFWYGLKEYDAAIDALYSALEFDPISTSILNMIGDVQLSAKRYKEAENTFLSILKMIPNDSSSLENLMYLASLQNNQKKATSYYMKLQKETPDDIKYTPRMGYFFAKFGLQAETNEYLNHFIEVSKKDPNRILHNFLAQVYSGQENWEEAMNCIEKGWKARTGILFILTDPQLEPLRKWKRYHQLVAEIQYPKGIENNDYITLKTDIKETVRINLKTLLFAKAEDNYTNLFFFQNFRLEQKLVRATLKTIENQLPNSFLRIHKTYIINNEKPFHLYGNAKSRFITQAHHNYEIPVSRSFDIKLLSK